MNFRISEQKINIVKEAKYLDLKSDQHLTFKQQMHTIKLKACVFYFLSNFYFFHQMIALQKL